MTDEDLTRSEVFNKFGEAVGELLVAGGLTTVSDVMATSDEDLLALNGIGPGRLKSIREKAPLVEVEAEIEVEEEPVEEEELPELADLEVGPVEPAPPEDVPTVPVPEDVPTESVRVRRARESAE